MALQLANGWAGAQEGWGIGLPFVRAVAESHGGGSVVDSSLERGTTFSMDMPLDARPSFRICPRWADGVQRTS